MMIGYVRFVVYTAVVIGVLESLVCWLVSAFFPLWLILASTTLCVVTARHLAANRGYRWLRYFPLLSLPVWLIALPLVVGIVGLFASGLEGTRLDSLATSLWHCALTMMLVTPAWLLVHVPFRRAVGSKPVRESFTANDRLRAPMEHRALLFGVGTILFTVVFAALPIGLRRVRLIHAAAACGWATATKVLLAAGMPPGLRDANGDTPLHFAAAEGRPGVVEVLVSGGANMNARNHSGETPLLRAIVKLRAPSDGASWTHDFDTDSRRDCTMYLIRKGADVRVADDEGVTPMEHALDVYDVYRATPQVLTMLVDHGADINARGFGGTWADCAIGYGRLDEARTVIRRGGRITPGSTGIAK